MNTQNVNQAQYFDSVLYARAYINEIKIISPKKGDDYCAVNATIVETIAEKTTYQTIDLIVKGKPAKRVLWALKDRWPADRFSREGERWIADINVGSITNDHFPKKDGSVGAVLKGRLLNIRGLRIGDEIVHGEMSEAPDTVYNAVCYINDLNVTKGTAKIAVLDGPTNEPNYKNLNIRFNADDFAMLGEMVALGLCPKGYANRVNNPKVFAILTLKNLHAEGFEGRDSKPASCLKADLLQVRYLKANDTILVGKPVVAA